MNTHSNIGLDATSSSGKGEVDRPEITIRNRRFGRDKAQKHHWLNGDAVATAWHNGLSATFPRGEAMFIEAVKTFRPEAEDESNLRLSQEIRAFIRQEINHTREHLAFNRAAEQAGYDLTGIDARVEKLINDVYEHPPIVSLAVTIALEHFTAMFASEFLSNDVHFMGGEGSQADLWRWHAAEEIEHKGVAFDTWLYATRDWSRFKRWKIKSLLMIDVTKRFAIHRTGDALELLKQDGIDGWNARWKLAKYLLISPGMMRRIIPHWCAYFLPGFHPWNHDDRHLIGKYDSEYAAANLPKEAASPADETTGDTSA